MRLTKKVRGFTLIEVLIALAILAIALTSLILMTSEITSRSQHLEQKAIANWVGQNIITQARLGMISLPHAPKELSGSVEYLGKRFQWQANRSKTEDKHTDRINIDISPLGASRLLHMTSCVRVQ